MLYQVDDALLHAMSGIELSRVRTELRLLLPEAYQQKSDRVERGRHCYAIKWSASLGTVSNRPSAREFRVQSHITSVAPISLFGKNLRNVAHEMARFPRPEQWMSTQVL
jgi:hypothetical protein